MDLLINSERIRIIIEPNENNPRCLIKGSSFSRNLIIVGIHTYFNNMIAYFLRKIHAKLLHGLVFVLVWDS